MLEKPNENALSDEELEQVTGGWGPHRKSSDKKGARIRAKAWAASNMEAEADAKGYAEADARFF